MLIVHVLPPIPKNRIADFLLKTNELYIPHTTDLVKSLDEYAEKLSLNADSFFLCDAHKDVGYCALYANKPDMAFISTIGVMKDYQSKGMGGALLNAAISFAKEKGFSRIALEVDPSNIVAITFYQRHGFVEIERRGRMVYMELRLRNEKDGFLI